jgi:hypothetical protein
MCERVCERECVWKRVCVRDRLCERECVFVRKCV